MFYIIFPIFTIFTIIMYLIFPHTGADVVVFPAFFLFWLLITLDVLRGSKK